MINIDKLSYSANLYNTKEFKNPERIKEILKTNGLGGMRDLFDREVEYTPVNFFTSPDYDDKLKEIVRDYPHLLFEYA